ncbi:MAG: DUF89 family protein [Anaerolineaceae bacterium]|nr:DUF89 family protein [Anaerolineaceae bacterium]
MVNRPAMILTDESNAFAHDTMFRRLPSNIREVALLNPDYPAVIRDNLKRLAAEIESDAVVRPFNPFSPDADLWETSLKEHEGHTWLHTDWFFAEIAAYRHLIETVRWWEYGRDPFAPQKAREMGSDALWALLDKALELRGKPIEDRLQALVHSDLWGNRIDLSFGSSMAHGNTGSHDDLLTDDSVAAVEHLMQQNGDVHFIADNTGTELAVDLALADALFDKGMSHITFHIKLHPTFVSDIIVADMLTMFNAMRSGEYGEAIKQLGQRLQTALDEGRLRLAPGAFWNSPYVLREMPNRFVEAFKGAALVIIKGDLNYRRMVDDALWPADTAFADVVDYFPAPLLALRTMKSDAVVGLETGLAERLDGEDARWRVNGKRGVIHFKK